MTNKNTNTEIAIAYLTAKWGEVIAADTAAGIQGAKEFMMESMSDQITGYQDMSAEDFDETAADIMGWEDLDGHEDEWQEIVTKACKRYLVMIIGEGITDDDGNPIDPISADDIADCLDIDEDWEFEHIRSAIEDYCDR